MVGILSWLLCWWYLWHLVSQTPTRHWLSPPSTSVFSSTQREEEQQQQQQQEKNESGEEINLKIDIPFEKRNKET